MKAEGSAKGKDRVEESAITGDDVSGRTDMDLEVGSCAERA